MAGNIDDKLKKVKKQGYKAAKENKIFPRELQNAGEDRWEDAKLYSMNTRQGQNYWQDHMKGMSQIQRKQTRDSDTQRGNRAKAPTPPTPSPVPKRPSTTSQANKETVRRYEDAFASKKKKK
jgi:hypothetical protein